MKDSYYSREELTEIGLKIPITMGDNIKISRKCSIYTADVVIRGENVRIDDFCFLSGHIEIGNYVHIAPYCLLNGKNGGIFLDDFVNIGSRVSIYSNSDNFSGDMMTGPLIPEEYKNVISGSVKIGRHCIIGANSFIMPGVSVKEGNAFGAYSFIKSDADPWGIYVGIPAERIKERSKKLLLLEANIP